MRPSRRTHRAPPALLITWKYDNDATNDPADQNRRLPRACLLRSYDPGARRGAVADARSPAPRPSRPPTDRQFLRMRGGVETQHNASHPPPRAVCDTTLSGRVAAVAVISVSMADTTPGRSSQIARQSFRHSIVTGRTCRISGKVCLNGGVCDKIEITG